ncbi:hypothetical protein B0T17DRAFT_519673 [Bombardia bombarda]|uniref:C2H2-type domain-containing protein n=1 Tax=Bombardia bombarda TaxID=252184 RepID=A0AA39XN70_9PEZI|nr:hypothetical protein B0T17DRAFT_519673 [Bombardia bombarda]
MPQLKPTPPMDPAEKIAALNNPEFILPEQILQLKSQQREAKSQQNALPKPVYTAKRTGHLTGLNPLKTRAGSWSSNSPTLTPTSLSPLKRPWEPEPEPARIRSDIATVAAQPDSTATSPGHQDRETERREALRVVLKQRWASGAMGHVPAERAETVKRRRNEIAGEQGVSASEAAPAGSLQAVYQKSRLSSNFPNLAGLESLPFSHSRNLSSSGQLAQPSSKPRSLAHTNAFEKRQDSTGGKAAPEPPSSNSASMPVSDTELVENTPFEQNEPLLVEEEEDDDWEGGSEPSDASADDSQDLGEDLDEENEVIGEREGDNADTKPGVTTVVEPLPEIEMAAPDRPYRAWKTADGALSKTYGALIPEGYKLSNVVPNHPWICPVRSCRFLLKHINGLGAHCSVKHRGEMLHDNEDGTFTIKGVYTGGATRPPIVISKGPIDPSEPTMANPTFSKGQLYSMRIKAKKSFGPKPVVKPEMFEPRGAWKALWNYVQPFLVKHKGARLPGHRGVRQLITLPQVRELEWNAQRHSHHPFLDSKPRDISAMIVQLTGEPAPQPCTRCQVGKGPFKGCVVMSKEAHSEPMQSFKSCANCYYHFGQTYCSLKGWGEQRAKEILAIRYSTQNGDDHDEDGQVRHEQNKEAQDDDFSMNYATTVQDSFMSVTDVPEDPENPDDSVGMEAEENEISLMETPEAGANRPLGINMAEPHRPYSVWPDENGALQPLHGALLPAGYKLDDSIPGRSWICPVRSCRRVYGKRQDLGYHFTRVHYANLLNDNSDGTFTPKGVYMERETGKGSKDPVRAPPVVVSKTPTSTTEDPILEPRPPDYLGIGTEPESLELKQYLPPPVIEPLSDSKGLWVYIQPRLTRTKFPTESGFVTQLLEMPRLRDLQLNPYQGSHEGFYEKTSRDVAAMIIQVTGEKITKGCGRCCEGKGPFQGCVVIARKSHAEARSRYISCANCLYHGKQVLCTLKSWVPKRKQPPFPKYGIVGGRSMVGEPWPGEAEPGLLPAQESSEAGEVEDTPMADSMAHLDTRSLRPARRPQPQPEAQPQQQRQRALPAPASSLISVGNFNTADALEMEDWEVAPGRIREAAGANPDTIAFSKPYLSSGKDAPVHEDVSVRIDTIRPGNSLRMAADANKMRLCTLTTGKVRVKIGEEPEFTIGPNCMFKIKAGATCTVQNRMHMNAIVQVTSLAGFV